MLIKDMKVPVADGQGNVIMIRAKMDFQTRSRVMDASVTIVPGTRTTTANLGAGRMALLEHNILAWEGPAFIDEATGRPHPCTVENIRSLDPDEPLVEKVLEELDKRNGAKATDPNVTESTSTGAAG